MTKNAFKTFAEKHGVAVHYNGRTKTFHLEGTPEATERLHNEFIRIITQEPVIEVSFGISNHYRPNSRERGRQLQQLRRIGRKEREVPDEQRPS
jgi:hypothetical protein